MEDAYLLLHSNDDIESSIYLEPHEWTTLSPSSTLLPFNSGSSFFRSAAKEETIWKEIRIIKQYRSC